MRIDFAKSQQAFVSCLPIWLIIGVSYAMEQKVKEGLVP
jgi:hypothetical protein